MAGSSQAGLAITTALTPLGTTTKASAGFTASQAAQKPALGFTCPMQAGCGQMRNPGPTSGATTPAAGTTT